MKSRIYFSGIIAILFVVLWWITIVHQRSPVYTENLSGIEMLYRGDIANPLIAVGRDEKGFLTLALFETLEKVLRQIGQRGKYGLFNFKLGMEVSLLNKEFALQEREHKGKVIWVQKSYSGDTEVIFLEWNEPYPVYQNCQLKRVYIWVTTGRVNHLSFVLSCKESNPKTLSVELFPDGNRRWEEWHGVHYYIACLDKQDSTGSWVIAELAPGQEPTDWILSFTVRPCFFDPNFTLTPLYKWQLPEVRKE